MDHDPKRVTHPPKRAVITGAELAAAGALLPAVVLASCSVFGSGDSKPAARFNGFVLEPPFPTTEFTLTNQRGETFRLDAARGKLVVLTFLYTSCTDVCPFVGIKLKQTTDLLGADSASTEFVVVSTDPERDTLERTAEYSRELGMFDGWHYLAGPNEALQPVRRAYFVGVPQIADDPEFASFDELRIYGLLRGLDNQAIGIADSVRRQYGGGYDVGHSTPVWLIDRDGQIRVKLGQDLAPAELAEDIRLLLKEP